MGPPYSRGVPRYAFLLAYDGADFAGWWRQPGRRTVGAELDAAFTRLGEPGGAPVGASRTDAGVHALGQLAHVDLSRAWDPPDLVRRLGHHLPPDLVCRAAAAVPDDWHAVFGVRRKTYRYRLALDRQDPFAFRTAWLMPKGLDAAALHACGALAPGRRDWAAFVRRGDRRTDTDCRVLACRWRTAGPVWHCDLTADGFIYHLARSLVGGMVLAARGGTTVADWSAALAGTVTPAATQLAPAAGLHLLRVVHRQPPRWAP